MTGRRPFYRNPKIQTLLVTVVVLLFYLYLTWRAGELFTARDLLKSAFYVIFLRFGKIPPSVRLLVLDMLIFTVGMLFWMGFFSQFILPLRGLRDRYQALIRLGAYLIGEHGPAIFIENGQVHQRRKETRRRGPGLVMLDSASGAVLRNDFVFTRPVGPGVVFTRPFEYLAKAVDLHTKSTRLGPNIGEDPFKPWDEENEENALYQKRQERRTQTSGLTRDGVEVVPTVQVTFRLKRRPGDRSFSFGYNPVAVQQWVTADGAVTAGSSESNQATMPLEQLPADIAADLWREFLQKFTLSELFTPPVGDQGRAETAYATISRMVRARLTKPFVPELDSKGQPTGRQVPSHEYVMMSERGIDVLGASIFNLHLKEDIERRLVEQWVATWLERAQAERIRVEQIRSYVALAGRQTGLEEFVRASVEDFPSDIHLTPRPGNERDEHAQMRYALETLVQGTLNGMIHTPQLIQLLQGEESNLRNLLAWIEEQET